ncbi:MAG: hypothetical protein AAFQ85_05800, partial [Pseudomonadota bacterium]
MKLATLNDGSRDGRLVVVSNDLTKCTSAQLVSGTLQEALDDWASAEPKLRTLAEELEAGTIPSERFHE